jgi:hypothetical protein
MAGAIFALGVALAGLLIFVLQLVKCPTTTRNCARC